MQRCEYGNAGAPPNIKPEVNIDLSDWRSDTTSSGYLGVCSVGSAKHEAYLHHNDVLTCLGSFDTAEGAATAFATKHLELIGAPIKQKPSTKDKQRPASGNAAVGEAAVGKQRKQSRAPGEPTQVPTGTKGVCQKASGRFSVKFAGTYLGTFDTLEEAAAVRFAAEEHGQIEDQHTDHPKQTLTKQAATKQASTAAIASVEGSPGKSKKKHHRIELEAFRTNCASGYLGVSQDHAEGKYKAKLTVGGKFLHLGVFSTAEEAAYVSAAKYLQVHGAPPSAGVINRLSKSKRAREEESEDACVDISQWRSAQNSSG